MAIVDVASQLIGDFVANYALIYQNQRYIGTLVPDVTVSELSTDEDTVTNHPVETGTPISDHVFANPPVLEIRCGFSNSSAGYDGYVQDVYQMFLDLKNTREPFDVSTGKRFYTSMLFTNLTTMTDESSEWVLNITARLQQIIITDTDDNSGSGMTQQNQSDPSSTAPESNAGNQQLQPAPSASMYSDYENSFSQNTGQGGQPL